MVQILCPFDEPLNLFVGFYQFIIRCGKEEGRTCSTQFFQRWIFLYVEQACRSFLMRFICIVNADNGIIFAEVVEDAGSDFPTTDETNFHV